MRVWRDLRGEDASTFYDSEYFDGAGDCNGYGGYHFDKLVKGFRYKLHDVKAYCPEGGRILDVGCAKGFFVKLALHEGFDAYGVDFSRYAIEEAKKIVGDRAILADLEKEKIFPNASFDVITGWDFLEHLKDPEMFLRKANSLLRRGGYLFLTTVNFNSLMARLMHNNWRFKSPGHISYFITPNLLREWLPNYGFRPLKIRTFGLNLKPLPRRMKYAEKALYNILIALQPFLRLTELGDSTYCISQKL